MTAHAVTDNSHKPIVFGRVNDLEDILIVMPSTCLAYCCIFYLHITILLGL